MALNKDNIKTLIGSTLVGFHNNILRNKLVPTGGTTGQVLSKTSDTDNDVQWISIPTNENNLTDELKANYDAAYTHSQSAHFDGDYNSLINKPDIPNSTKLTPDNYTVVTIADGTVKWIIYNLQEMQQGKTYLLENPSPNDLIFTNKSKIAFGLPTLTYKDGSPSIEITPDNFGKSYSFMHDDDAGMWYFYIGEEYYTIKDYDYSTTVVANVKVKHYKKYLALDNTTAYTPTNDYNPVTKKYVDDQTFDKNYNSLTNKPIIPSIKGLATEEYVNNKVFKRNIIFDADMNSSDGTLDTYYTDCSISNGAGSFVYDFSIDINSTSNPYYLLIDNTDLYSPEDSTYDSANNGWIYTSKEGKEADIIFICNKYGDQNKLILPWESAGYCSNIKVFTQQNLQNIAFTSDYNDLINLPDIPSIEGLATETYVDNKFASEEIIFDGNETNPLVLHGYYTHVPIADGMGFWVIDKTIEIDSSNNPYTIEISGGQANDGIYGPDVSTFNSTYNMWVYDLGNGYKFQMGNIDYNGSPALAVAWDDAGSYSNLKVTKKVNLINTINNKADKKYVDDNISSIAVPTKTSDLTNDSGFITSIPSEYITETELTAKNYIDNTTLESKGYLTEHQDLSGYALRSDLHTHANKAILDAITDAKITEWNSKSTFSGSYNDLTNKPTIPAAYTHPSTHPASMITGLATVATSGSYNDLTNKPTIPTVSNDLTNALKANYDAAYTHSQSAHAPSNAQKNSDITKAEIEAKLTGDVTTHTHSQYLTEHQSLTGYATEEFVNNRLSSLQIVPITQADYDALTTKDPNTLYLITTTNAGSIDNENNITLSSDLPSGRYTLKYEDENGQPLSDFDNITTMEV